MFSSFWVSDKTSLTPSFQRELIIYKDLFKEFTFLWLAARRVLCSFVFVVNLDVFITAGEIDNPYEPPEGDGVASPLDVRSSFLFSHIPDIYFQINVRTAASQQPNAVNILKSNLEASYFNVYPAFYWIKLH